MHPLLEKVEAASLDWAAQMGLCPDERRQRRLEETRSAELCAGMTPDGIATHLEIAAQWVYWECSFGDAWRDGEGDRDPVAGHLSPLVRQVGRVLRVLETLDARLCGDDPHLRALHDLATRYRGRATPVQMQRWVNGQRLWLFGVIRQSAHRADSGPGSIDDFLSVRIHDCGGPPTQSMYEFVNGLEVPGSEMDSPAVRAITEAFWLVTACDNDRVFRYEQSGGHGNDLVDAVRRSLGCSSEEAAAEAVALRDRAMTLFLALRHRVTSSASTALRSYLVTLGHGIRSNIDWSLQTPRSTRADGTTVHIELSGRCTDDPSHGSLDPRSFPTIAWWWDQL
jgi:hypothetical protein